MGRRRRRKRKIGLKNGRKPNLPSFNKYEMCGEENLKGGGVVKNREKYRENEIICLVTCSESQYLKLERYN